jgi:hypothetical protein
MSFRKKCQVTVFWDCNKLRDKPRKCGQTVISERGLCLYHEAERSRIMAYYRRLVT